MTAPAPTSSSLPSAIRAASRASPATGAHRRVDLRNLTPDDDEAVAALDERTFTALVSFVDWAWQAASERYGDKPNKVNEATLDRLRPVVGMVHRHRMGKPNAKG